MASPSVVIDFDAPPSPDRPMERASDHLAVGAAIVVVVTFGFFLLFFNRFAGIRMTNGSGLSGQAILAGRLPYRDWFSPVPPMHFLKNAVLVWLFGRAVIMPRFVALFERSLLALTLYLWLARLVRVPFAAFGAAVAIIVSAGDLADPISSYNHDTIFWAVLTGYLASICLDRSSDRSLRGYSLVCGVCAGVCFSYKQTIGLGITVGVPAVVAASIWRVNGLSGARRFCGLFFAGWLAPLTALWLWLFHNRILGLYFRQIFIKGPSAKAGGLSDFAVRWVRISFGNLVMIIGFVMAMLVLIPILKRLVGPSGRQCEPINSSRGLVLVLVLLAGAIAAGRFAAYNGFPPIVGLSQAAIFLSLFASGCLAAYFAALFVLRELGGQQSQFWLLSTVSFVCAFMLSLSWPAFEAMTIPGLGFLVAAFLDRSPRDVRLACYAACCVLLFSLTVSKLYRPFGFIDWADPSVRTATARSSLPELKGFLLPQAEVAMLEGITGAVRDHSRPGDTIFTYPPMPIFYSLSGRWFPTYGVDHNVDACPDDIARRDAAALLRVKPAVIVYYRQDPAIIREDEILWRRGARSGQRDIIAAIETLAKEYSLVGSYNAPSTNLKVQVYVRH